MKNPSLEEHGYLRLSYPPALKLAVNEAAESWVAFCGLPEESKVCFLYTDDSAVGSGVGYELKKGKKDFDLKENFHVRASQRPWLMTEARKVGPIAVEFISAALNVNAQLFPFVRDFARMAESEYHMSGFEKDVVKSLPLWTLRFLHYFPTEDDNALMAIPHADKGGFTPHLWESAPGLERLTMHLVREKRRWVPMPFGHDETVLFPGLRLQLRSQGRLKGTCHRVVCNAETAAKGRFSAVAFADFLGTPYYDKEHVGRTQNFAPGFNYDMPLPEFAKLFVSADTKKY